MTPAYTPRSGQLFDPNDPNGKKNYLLSHGYNDQEATDLMRGASPMAASTTPIPSASERKAFARKQLQPVSQGIGFGSKGAIINTDNLESLRSSGESDDGIADQMALSSPRFAQQLKNIRKKYGNDPSATTAFLNTRFYGDTEYDPTKQGKPKNYVAKILDYAYGIGQDIYNTAEQDILGEGGTLNQYTLGEIGAGDAVLRTAQQIYGSALSPVNKPFMDATKGALDFTGGTDLIKGAVEGVRQSELGQDLAPYVQDAVEGYQNLPQDSNLRNLVAAGQAGLDTLGVLGAQGTVNYGKGIVSRGASQATHPLQTLRHPIQSTRHVLTGKNPASAQAEGVRELAGKAKEAVKSGMDEQLMTFAAEKNVDTRAVMAKMTKQAFDDSKVLQKSLAHKKTLGGQMLNNLTHLMERKDVIGKALGAMKASVADDIINLTDDYGNFLTELRNKGAVINDKGQIISLAGAADDNIPLLQQTLDFFTDGLDDAGNVVKTGKNIDQWRTKMFEEMNSAKAKLQPSAAGQRTFGFAEDATNKVRRASLEKMAQGNRNLIAANDTFENLATETSNFLKAIGYKGKLSPEAITAKQLKAGEISLRTLGNASADTREAFTRLIQAAKEAGYNSNVDDMALVTYADKLEDLFPITPTRSLSGQVSRATRDALGNVTEDIVNQGAKRGIINAASTKVIEAFDKMRGLTPENRFRLLMEVLEAPDETSFFTVAKEVLPDEQAKKLNVKGVDAGDMKPAAREVLTPEEKATGLIGGGGDAMPRTAVADDLDDVPLSQIDSGEAARVQSLTPEQVKSEARVGGSVAKVKIPTFAEAQKLIGKHGGYSKISSESPLAVKNAYAAQELSNGVGFREDFIYQMGTERNIDLLQKLKEFDDLRGSGGDTIKFSMELHDELTTGNPFLRSTKNAASGLPQPQVMTDSAPSAASSNNAQNVSRAMRHYFEKNGIKVNPDDTVTLYHVTTPEIASRINKEGFIKGSTTATGGLPGTPEKLQPSAFAGFDKRLTVDRWGGSGSRDAVVEVRVPVAEIRHPAQDLEQAFFEGGLKKGSDGLWHPVKLQSTFVDKLALREYLHSTGNAN